MTVQQAMSSLHNAMKSENLRETVRLITQGLGWLNQYHNVESNISGFRENFVHVYLDSELTDEERNAELKRYIGPHIHLLSILVENKPTVIHSL